MLDVACARYGRDPVEVWETRTLRQIGIMYRLAVRGNWRDDAIVLRAGGLTRDEPDWRSVWKVGHAAKVDEKAQQAALQHKHADQIASIKKRLRDAKTPKGEQYSVSRDARRIVL